MHTVLTCLLLKVLVLIIAILFQRVIGIGNTFWPGIGIGYFNTFY